MTLLEQRIPIVLTKLQLLLPAWELNMNRHMMLHLVQAIKANGLCCFWAMFGVERFWKCDAHKRGRASAYGCNAMQGAHTGKVGTEVVTRCDSSR